LTDRPGVSFYIETPAGDIMTPASAGGLGAVYAVGTNMSYYRFTLPLALGAQPAQAGTWYAILEMTDRKVSSQWAASVAGASAGVNGIRYCRPALKSRNANSNSKSFSEF